MHACHMAWSLECVEYSCTGVATCSICTLECDWPTIRRIASCPSESEISGLQKNQIDLRRPRTPLAHSVHAATRSVSQAPLLAAPYEGSS